MIVGSNGVKAGILAILPLVILNIISSLLFNPSIIARSIVDSIVMLIVASILGFLVAAIKKALFFVRISYSNLAVLVGLAVAGLLIYDGRPQVLIGSGLKFVSEQYLGPSTASVIPPLAAGLLWGLLMGTFYGLFAKPEEKTAGRIIQRGILSRIFSRKGIQLGVDEEEKPAVKHAYSPPVARPVYKVEKDKCAVCGRKKGGIFGSKVKFMECKRDGTIYCEECYSKFPIFGGITRACPRCGGALSPMND